MFVSDPQPLYGLLQAKLQLITHAYFEEKDFSQISILKVSDVSVSVSDPPPPVDDASSAHLLFPFLQELYDHMNGSLRGSTLEGSQVYLGGFKVT